MIPVGYMYNKVAARADSHPANVVDIYSVAGCGGQLGAHHFSVDYIQFWKHNGYWLFNNRAEMDSIAAEHNIDLSDMTLFYYEAYIFEFDLIERDKHPNTGIWSPFECDQSWLTDVSVPETKTLAGYDVVEFVGRSAPEDSLLACCPGLSSQVALNQHCLFDTFDKAKSTLESGIFHRHEPGPYRIFAVYVV